MTAHRALNLSLALLIAALLAIVGPALDGPSDHHTEALQALDLEDAQLTEARLLRRDMAAARLCREQHGEAGYTWTAADQLVCVPRRGKAVVQVAMQVQP